MSGEPSLVQIFLNNLFKYDFIVILTAFANFWFYILVRRTANKLYYKMHLTIFLPTHPDPGSQAVQDLFNISEHEVIALRKRTGVLYSIFTALTTTFTLLGILGTVIYLIPLVQQMESVKVNFFGALTATFWGLVFAILFKVLDAFIAGRIEDNEKTVALFLERNAASVSRR